MSGLRSGICLTIALCASLIAIQPAFASGGGGGGEMMPSAPPYDPADDYQKGTDAYQAQDFKAAATALKRVTGGVPNFAPAEYLLGSSYMQLGDFKKAKKPLELAVKYDATMIDAQRDLGITYAKLGDTPKATGQRDALTAIKTACAQPCANAATLDAAIQAIDTAMAGTPQALAPMRSFGSPASAEAIYVSAVGLINEAHYGAAIAQLEEALWTTGPNPDLLTYLGFANRKLRRYDTARTWYEEALTVAPNHRGALEYYGELKIELGEMKGARHNLARLDMLCGFGCQQADELRRWVREGGSSAS